MKYIVISYLLFFGVTMTAQVGIGTTTPNSTLSVEGSLATKVDVVLFPTTLDENYHTLLSDDQVTLPDPSNIIGREYIIKAGNIGGTTISAQPGDLIDGSSSPLTLKPYESVKVKAAAAGSWFITGGNFEGVKEINDLTDGKTGFQSVYIGEFAGLLSTSGSNNVAMGVGAALNLNGGDNNVLIGASAGALIQTGSANILIGQNAAGGGGNGITTGSNNIVIGSNISTSTQTTTNELNIGSALYATGLYGSTARVGVGNGNNAPNSTLSVSGSMSLPIRSGTATTLTDNDYTYILLGGNVQLPAASGRLGRIYIIKNGTTANHIVQTTGSDRIDGSNNQTIIGGSSIIVQSDGATEWWIIGSY